jgi:hypothetical protein
LNWRFRPYVTGPSHLFGSFGFDSHIFNIVAMDECFYLHCSVICVKTKRAALETTKRLLMEARQPKPSHGLERGRSSGQTARPPGLFDQLFGNGGSGESSDSSSEHEQDFSLFE